MRLKGTLSLVRFIGAHLASVSRNFNVGKGDRRLTGRSHALAVYGAIPDL
jgi:hypothetical protein